VRTGWPIESKLLRLEDRPTFPSTSVVRRRREPPRCRRLLIALLASAASFAIRDAPAAEDPCAVNLFRWQEDCRKSP
jgi:hypothetical protein